MLTPDEITYLQEKSARLLQRVNDFLIDDICRRVRLAGEITNTAAYQIYRAKRLGMSEKELKKLLKKQLRMTDREINKLFKEAAKQNYRRNYMQSPTVSFEDNTALQQIVSAAIDRATNSIQNITETLGMRGPDGRDLPLRRAYTKAMDYAFTNVVTGRMDYQTAIREAIKNIGDMGVRVIEYESGVTTSLERAVRRNIMGELGLMSNRITQKVREENGFDGWEISAHANSAPDHEPHQGRQFSNRQYKALNKSLKRPIGTLNCGHVAFPIMLGISQPQYTEEQLQKFIDDNKKGVTYEGKHYTGYEATQRQRRYERAIRREKNRIVAYTAAGDEVKLQQSQIKLNVLKSQYNDFSKAAGLPTDSERLQTYDFTSKDGYGVRKTNKAVETEEGIKEFMTKQMNALPKDSKDYLTLYTGNTAATLNMGIRNNRLNESQKEIMAGLDKALKDGIFPADYTMYRDTTLNFLEHGLDKELVKQDPTLLIGKEITNRIYTSTSFKALNQPGRDTVIWLSVPKGYEGCQYIDKIAYDSAKGQQEVLFARGLKYRITDAKIENGKYILWAKVIQ